MHMFCNHLYVYYYNLRHLPLLKEVREFQEYWHKPKYNDWDILLTCGSMDGCNKVFEMILEIGDPIMVQVPTYDGILNAVNFHYLFFFFIFV